MAGKYKLDNAADDDSHPPELHDALEAYRDELQNTVDSLDGSVDFPGMFG